MQSSPSGKPNAIRDAAAASFASLVQKLDYLSAADVAQVRAAYKFADEAHLGQFRSSGEPYITHPIAVASLCADWKLDAQALMAALLHDSMEDCGVRKTEIVERFGAPTAELVDGVTKLEKMQFNTREEGQAESFRKMLLAMARDVRVILVKLADRTHNMRTLDGLRPDKQRRISRETMDIYAPIANRLGLNQVYRELQDLSFMHIWPWRAHTLQKAVAKALGRRRDMVQRVSADVQQSFKAANLKIELYGREKTLYSIYRKMENKHLSFAQVTDLLGFRIIVKSLQQCYIALGVLHQLYKPITGKFKDYIAIPKVNGYQSLHTTLIGPASTAVEFQIRTEAMHMVAESGVAAHWLYKARNTADNGLEDERLNAQWLQSLLDIQNETRDSAEFLEHVKIDLYPDAVYVFTPKSKILSLPRGATVVDFAYAIHSDIGDHCVAAKVNGEQVPLRTELVSGDVVEVITAPVSHPNPAWLTFVRTGRARAKIRAHLKTMEQTAAVGLGEKLLSQALRAEGIDALPSVDGPGAPIWEKLLRITDNKTCDELLADIGLGRRIAHIVAKRMVGLLAEQGIKPDVVLLSMGRAEANDPLRRSALLLDGGEDISVQYATCCHPIPGDEILGYLGRGDGLTVHTAECSVAKHLRRKDAERWLEVAWSDEIKRPFQVEVSVTVSNNRKGMLAHIASALADAGVDILRIDMGDGPVEPTDTMRLLLAVDDRVHLAAALRALRRVPDVLHASRVKAV